MEHRPAPSFDEPSAARRLIGAVDGKIAALNGKIDEILDVKLKDIQIALLEKYTPFIITHNYMNFWARWKYVKDWEFNLAYPTQPMYRTELWLER